MRPIHRLIEEMAAAEEALRQTTFLAPCVAGGKVRTRVAGLVRTFDPQPPGFEGWGLFRPLDGKRARMVEAADLPLVGEYLHLLKPLRVRLAYALQGQTWTAYPVNESDARQRTGAARPVVVRLVSDGDPFEPVVARTDGAAWWCEEPDRRADPMPAEHLRDALGQAAQPGSVRFAGMTPEMRTAYGLAYQQTEDYRRSLARNRAEERLREALQVGGGDLRAYRDRGDYWVVEWTTRTGERHTSAISKSDLTVVSAGICLSGEDRKFDLQSLVGVIEGRWE